MTNVRREGPVVRHLTRPILMLTGIAVDIEVHRHRTGGTERCTVVPVRVGDSWYLLSTYGRSHWSHNLRADGHGTLTRKGVTTPFEATEVAGAERDQVIAAFHAQTPPPFKRGFRQFPEAVDHPAFRLAFEGDPTATVLPRR